MALRRAADGWRFAGGSPPWRVKSPISRITSWPRSWKVFSFVEDHGMTQVDVRRGRVHPQLDAQRAPFLQLGDQFFFNQNFFRSARLISASATSSWDIFLTLQSRFHRARHITGMAGQLEKAVNSDLLPGSTSSASHGPGTPSSSHLAPRQDGCYPGASCHDAGRLAERTGSRHRVDDNDNGWPSRAAGRQRRLCWQAEPVTPRQNRAMSPNR